MSDLEVSCGDALVLHVLRLTLSCAMQNFINHVDGIVATNKLSSSAVDRAKQLSEACYSVSPSLHPHLSRPSFYKALLCCRPQSPLALTGALLKSHLKVTPKSALSSFYIFDAIARNAHDHVRRAAKAGSAASPDKASQAEAWLSSAEGIAEELTSTTLAKVPDSQKVRCQDAAPDALHQSSDSSHRALHRTRSRR